MTSLPPAHNRNTCLTLTPASPAWSGEPICAAAAYWLFQIYRAKQRLPIPARPANLNGATPRGDVAASSALTLDSPA